MLILKTQSNISGYDMDFIHECEITSSWDSLTDTATVVIPRKIIYKKDGKEVENITKGEDSIFRVGDPVSLAAGYDGGINTAGVQNRLNGYIASVSTKYPIEITVEDEMYQLKQVSVKTYTKNNLTLRQLLTDVLPVKYSSNMVVDDREVGNFRQPDRTAAWYLKELKSKHNIYTYFREGVLISGFPYITERANGKALTKPYIFDARKNIINSDSLEYKTQGLYKVKVIYKTTDKANESTAGEDGGDTLTFNIPNLTKKETQARADAERKKVDYTGFRGSFETFLEPQVRHGDSVQLIDDRITDKNGVYLVKTVTTSYGVSGGRQVIELDRIVAQI